LDEKWSAANGIRIETTSGEVDRNEWKEGIGKRFKATVLIKDFY